MPTGYTAILFDKPETSFRQYAYVCARAFGALVSMRDESLDVPLPVEIKPDSYYRLRAANIRDELGRLRKMSPEDSAYGPFIVVWHDVEIGVRVLGAHGILLAEEAFVGVAYLRGRCTINLRLVLVTRLF